MIRKKKGVMQVQIRRRESVALHCTAPYSIFYHAVPSYPLLAVGFSDESLCGVHWKPCSSNEGGTASKQFEGTSESNLLTRSLKADKGGRKEGRNEEI